MEFKTNTGDSPCTLHLGMLPTGHTIPMDIPHDSTLPMGLILPTDRPFPMGPNTYCKHNYQHGLLFLLLADVYFSPLVNGKFALSLDILETAMLNPEKFKQKQNMATVLWKGKNTLQVGILTQPLSNSDQIKRVGP